MITRTYTFVILALAFISCPSRAVSKEPSQTELVLEKNIFEKRSCSLLCVSDIEDKHLKKKFADPTDSLFLDWSLKPVELASTISISFIKFDHKNDLLLNFSGLSPPIFF